MPLLDSEEAESRNDILERLATWSLERLKAEGYCLTDLSAYWCKANQYGRPVAAFQLGPGIIFPENLKLECVYAAYMPVGDTNLNLSRHGMQVLVSRVDPLEETPYKGSIIQRTKTQLKICFPSTFEIDGPWRLDVDRTNLIFERMRKAISYLHYDPNHVEQLPQSDDQEYILLGTSLRDVLLRSEDPARVAHRGDFHALQASDDVSYPKDALSHGVREFSSKEFEGVFKDDIRIHSWAERYSSDDPLVLEGDPDLGSLNRSQIKAMATMIGKRISLVQGVNILHINLIHRLQVLIDLLASWNGQNQNHY